MKGLFRLSGFIVAVLLASVGSKLDAGTRLVLADRDADIDQVSEELELSGASVIYASKYTNVLIVDMDEAGDSLNGIPGILADSGELSTSMPALGPPASPHEGYSLPAVRRGPRNDEPLAQTVSVNLDRIDAEQVWIHQLYNREINPELTDKAQGFHRGQGVRVGILGTGIDMGHPDIPYKKGINFTTPDGSGFLPGGNDDIQDRAIGGHGHETAVAGIIAASDNGDRLIGVAPECELYIGRVVYAGSDPNAAFGSWLAGLDWMLEQKVQVVNMSLATPVPSYILPLIDSVFARYTAAGMVIVASAGNSAAPVNDGTFALIPAALSSVITVSASVHAYPASPVDPLLPNLFEDNDGVRHLIRAQGPAFDFFAGFSSFGPEIDVIAPGYQVPGYIVRSFLPPYTINFELSGTSYAVAHVTGAVALLLQQNPRLSTDDIKAVLDATSEPLFDGFTGQPLHPYQQGAGLIDVEAAVEFVKTMD